MKRVRVRVSGHVQGVFFRDSVRSEAARRDVAGWVRNCDDGTVEAVFEGDASALDGLVRFCREGPDQAQVGEVDVSEQEPEGLEGFEVR